MTDGAPTSTSVAFIILSTIVVLAGFAVSFAGLQVLEHSGVAGVYLFFFGNAAVWTVLFILGLHWYGPHALWLLLVAPLAFYQVALFLLFGLILRAH